MTEHVVNLYMHEVAMHIDHNVEEFKPPFTTEILRGDDKKGPDLLTPAHISALSVCLTSIDGIIDTFLSLEVDVIRTLPIFHFVRVAYAVVVLIKMYFAAATPGGELGKVIDKDNMKVEQYLDGLLETFKATAADEKSRPSAKFLMVLVMLKTWFHRQREHKFPPGKTEASNGNQLQNNHEIQTSKSAQGTPKQQQQHMQQNQMSHSRSQSEYTPANTPLQLLSEVATGNSRRPDSRSSYPGSSMPAQQNNWQQQPTPQHAQGPPMSAPQVSGPFPAYNDAVLAGNPHAIYNMPAMGGHVAQGMGGSIDPGLGIGADLEYSMGDGFEQAIGLTMGGDNYFGKYLTDDAFFGAMMDSVGGNAGNIFEGF